MKLSIILVFIFLILSTFIFLLVAQKTEATQGHHHGPYPTVIPTATPTPTPVYDPCEVEEKFSEAYLYDFDPCEPSPEPTPSQPVFLGNGDGRSDGKHTGGGYVAPQCNGIAPKAPIATGGERVDSDTVIVRWHRSTDSVNHYVLEYGVSKDNLEWGVPYIPSNMDHYELNGVPNTHIWFKVTAEADNYCVAHSEVMDP